LSQVATAVRFLNSGYLIIWNSIISIVVYKLHIAGGLALGRKVTSQIDVGTGSKYLIPQGDSNRMKSNDFMSGDGESSTIN